MAARPGPARVRRARTLAVTLGVAAVVVTADAISKALALHHLAGDRSVRVLDGLLTLRLTLNPGAAFGFGTSYTVIIALIACGVVVSVIRITTRLRSLAWTIGLGLLLLTGLWTPVAGRLVAVLELCTIPCELGSLSTHIFVATMATAVALVGPGFWSLDSRLYGWKRIDPPTPES